VRFQKHRRHTKTARNTAVALTGIVPLACWAEPREPSPTSTPILTASANASPTATVEISPVKNEIPKGILDPILKEAASLASVPREQLVVVRADAVVWNDGSLGCPEPGMEYTQALVNGYWVVISAIGKTYDFRVGRNGDFRLCPLGRGRPPLQSNDR
jgi:hypothetical protein